jgi:hypothetical protein
MRANEFITESLRTENPCWKGYHPVGTKKKAGRTVPNCVPANEGEGDPEGLPHLTPNLAGHIAQQIDTEGPHAVDKSINWGDGAAEELLSKIQDMLDDYSKGVQEDWQSINKKDKTDGMSKKAVKAYRRENPGSKLKTAVTTKPSKLKKGSKDAKRRKSFCARMSGNKGPMKDEKGRPTPKAKALKRWNCE